MTNTLEQPRRPHAASALLPVLVRLALADWLFTVLLKVKRSEPQQVHRHQEG